VPRARNTENLWEVGMKLYLISQKENNNWDTYDSFVVAAENEEAARTIIPLSPSKYGDWAFTLAAVEVKEIGTATDGTEAGTILGSFNAG